MRRVDSPHAQERSPSTGRGAPCSRCGEIGEELHIQSCFGEALRYSISFRCQHCGQALEADGEEPDASIRRALLDAGGEWGVLGAGDASKKLVANFLVNRRGLSRSAAVRLAKCLSEPLATGTKPEMACIEAQLAALGVSVALRRLA